MSEAREIVGIAAGLCPCSVCLRVTPAGVGMDVWIEDEGSRWIYLVVCGYCSRRLPDPEDSIDRSPRTTKARASSGRGEKGQD